jgi:hypothetical protein
VNTAYVYIQININETVIRNLFNYTIMGYLSNELCNACVLKEGELRDGRERASEQSLVAVYGTFSMNVDDVLTLLCGV